jgi:hypothetical protein
MWLVLMEYPSVNQLSAIGYQVKKLKSVHQKDKQKPNVYLSHIKLID